MNTQEYLEHVDQSFNREIDAFLQAQSHMTDRYASLVFEEMDAYTENLRMNIHDHVRYDRENNIYIEDEDQKKNPGVVEKIIGFIKRTIRNIVTFFKNILNKLKSVFVGYERFYKKNKNAKFGEIEYTGPVYKKDMSSMVENTMHLLSQISTDKIVQASSADDIEELVKDALDWTQFKDIEDTLFTKYENDKLSSQEVKEHFERLKDANKNLKQINDINKQATQKLNKLTQTVSKKDPNFGALSSFTNYTNSFAINGAKYIKNQLDSDYRIAKAGLVK